MSGTESPLKLRSSEKTGTAVKDAETPKTTSSSALDQTLEPAEPNPPPVPSASAPAGAYSREPRFRPPDPDESEETPAGTRGPAVLIMVCGLVLVLLVGGGFALWHFGALDLLFGKEQVAVNWPNVQLNGVLIGSEEWKNSVIVDEDMIPLGEHFQGMTVVAVQPEGAWFEYKGARKFVLVHARTGQ